MTLVRTYVVAVCAGLDFGRAGIHHNRMRPETLFAGLCSAVVGIGMAGCARFMRTTVLVP